MRISDWSSDVCSSDLHRANLHLAGHRDGPLLNLVQAQDRRLRHVEDRRRHQGAEHATVGDGETAATHLLQRKLAVAALGGEIAQRLLDFGEGLLRSEEHTSELQSLMRTSYAVYCLKKKRNTWPALLRVNKKKD